MACHNDNDHSQNRFHPLNDIKAGFTVSLNDATRSTNLNWKDVVKRIIELDSTIKTNSALQLVGNANRKPGDHNTHTCRRFGTNRIDASLMELIKILSRWNGIVNMIARCLRFYLVICLWLYSRDVTTL